MRERFGTKARRIWDELFLVVFVGLPVGLATALWHSLSSHGIARAVVADNTRGTLFSALISFAALLLSVMLAVLTIFTGMDERSIVKRFKKAEGQMYTRLVHAMLGPIFVSLALAALSIVCITFPSGADPLVATSLPDPSGAAVVFISITLGLAATCLAQGAYVATLIVKMQTFDGRPTVLTAADHPPAESKAELASRVVQETHDELPLERELTPSAV